MDIFYAWAFLSPLSRIFAERKVESVNNHIKKGWCIMDLSIDNEWLMHGFCALWKKQFDILIK